MRLGGLGAPEVLLIVLVIVLLFGPTKLGDLGSALGRGVVEFKQAVAPEPPAPQASTTESPDQTEEPGSRIADYLPPSSPAA